MASLSVERAGGAPIGGLLLACVAENGSASHPYFKSEALLRSADATRNLADAVHFLCGLHGEVPGIIEHAATRCVEPEARAWLDASGEAFAAERRYLARLAVSVGPLPGTPGGGASQAAMINQRNALATLAQSERKGCALGAAVAFIADWAPIRAILDFTAQRFRVDAPEFSLGSGAELRRLVDAVAVSRPIERALMFGAEQVAIQHRGMWDLLETREQARRES